MAETTTLNNSMEVVKLSPTTASSTTKSLRSNFALSPVKGTAKQPSTKQLTTSPSAAPPPPFASILSASNDYIAQAMGQTNGQSNGGKWNKSADGGRNANTSLVSHGAGASSCNGATSDASVHRSEPNSARNGGASIDLDGRASVVGKPTNPAASVVSISHCSDPAGCVTLADILKCFNAAVSEEQAWALIYQSVCLYRNALTSAVAVAAAAATNNSNNNNTATDDLMDSGKQTMLPDTRLPSGPHNFNVHKDGSVHLSFNPRGKFDEILFCSFVCLFLIYRSCCAGYLRCAHLPCVCVCVRAQAVR